MIGASFTGGAGVQQGEDIASQIRTMTNETTINLGIGGNGPLLELATLKEYAEHQKPKRILWLYFEGNDLNMNLPTEKRSPLLMNYLQTGFSQNLIQRQAEIDQRLEQFLKQRQNIQRFQLTSSMISSWMKLSKTRALLSSMLQPGQQQMIANETNQIIGANIDLFTEILTTAKRRVEISGGQFYFVYLPTYSRYNKKITNHDDYFNKKAVLDVAMDLDIPIIDIHEQVFVNHSDYLSLFPLRRHGHYNADGYRVVAEAIVTAIAEEERSLKMAQ